MDVGEVWRTIRLDWFRRLAGVSWNHKDEPKYLRSRFIRNSDMTDPRLIMTDDQLVLSTVTDRLFIAVV